METTTEEFEERRRLLLQVAEAYANLLYTYKTQLVAADNANGLNNRLSVMQTVLTSVSACGFVSIWLSGMKIAALVAAGLSVISLAITIYLKGANLSERANCHGATADAIWVILQGYLSLLADSRSFDLAEIRSRRDSLQKEVSSIYTKSPMTNPKAYSKARESIKAGDCGFSPMEIEQIFPVGLRDLAR